MAGGADRGPVTAVLLVTDEPEDHVPTVVSLLRADPGITVLCGAGDPSRLTPLVEAGATAVFGESASALVNLAWQTSRGHVLVVNGHVSFPSGGLSAAVGIVEEDLRVATVSLLSNAAGWLSFPYRNTPSVQLPPGLDEEVVTRRLRTAPGVPPVPVPHAVGPAVLISSMVLSALAPLSELAGIDADTTVAEVSGRGRDKGFVDVADASTFCMRFPARGGGNGSGPVLDTAPLGTVFERHPFLLPLAEPERAGEETPLGMAHRLCRAKALGLRILIDGSCLGPREMGTQIQTVALIRALARRDDVETVSVAVAGPWVGDAGLSAANPKIDVRVALRGDVSGFAPVDVLHRPFQPDEYLNTESWSSTAARTVVTILDLIAYQVGGYHGTVDRWATYRERMHAAVTGVDGIVVPSQDVRRQLELERLPVEPDRLSVVGLGTDHLTGDEPEALPAELLARGLVSGQFAVVLGSNYGHKNRDLAIRTVDELRRRGFPLSLILVGAAVPYGSSRVLEGRAAATFGDGLVVLPDVAAEERNWLLRQASFVLYPTSAEGFGFIPYEAARFGTPTVLVGTGPLAPLAERLPVVAGDWHPRALADAAARLLTDPALAGEQCAAVLAYGREQTWDGTAAALVDVYRGLLARPPLPGRVRTSGHGAVVTAR